MDLLKTLLIYMTMVFATSVQSAPEAMDILTATPEPTPYVAAATATPVPTPETHARAYHRYHAQSCL